MTLTKTCNENSSFVKIKKLINKTRTCFCAFHSIKHAKILKFISKGNTKNNNNKLYIPHRGLVDPFDILPSCVLTNYVSAHLL
jgi:hypothetical protein